MYSYIYLSLCTCMYSECGFVLDQACLPSPRELASPPEVKSLTAGQMAPSLLCPRDPGELLLPGLFPPEGVMGDRQHQEMTSVTPSLSVPS